MVLKVDRDLDNVLFNISDMHMMETLENDEMDKRYIMLINFSARYVKYAYTIHEYYGTEPECVEIIFADDKKLQIFFHDCDDVFKYPEKLINEIFKMKMLDTKWAEKNPEKYI